MLNFPRGPIVVMKPSVKPWLLAAEKFVKSAPAQKYMSYVRIDGGHCLEEPEASCYAPVTCTKKRAVLATINSARDVTIVVIPHAFILSKVGKSISRSGDFSIFQESK